MCKDQPALVVAAIRRPHAKIAFFICRLEFRYTELKFVTRLQKEKVVDVMLMRASSERTSSIWSKTPLKARQFLNIEMPQRASPAPFVPFPSNRHTGGPLPINGVIRQDVFLESLTSLSVVEGVRLLNEVSHSCTPSTWSDG